MGRLAWLALLGAGPLAAGLLVARERAGITQALAAVETARAEQDLPWERSTIAAAREAAECALCGADDRGLVELAAANLAEAQGSLDAAKSTFAQAVSDLSDHGRVDGPHQLASTGYARVITEITERDQQAKEDARRAQEAAAAAKRASENSPSALDARVTRAEATLSSGDARTALSMLADIDAHDGSLDPGLRDRALIVDGRSAALQGNAPRSDDFFAQAVTLELDHPTATWSDPPSTLRTWSDTVGSRVSDELSTSLQRVERVFDLSTSPNATTMAARTRMVRGEMMLAHGNPTGAADVLGANASSLESPELADATRITRDLVELAQVESVQKHWGSASNHLHTAALRLDSEGATARERSEAWRHLSELYTDHPHRAGMESDVLDAAQRALAAAVSGLDPEDPEVIHDRLEVGLAQVGVGNRKAAREEAATVDRVTQRMLQGVLAQQLTTLHSAVSTGAIRPAPQPPGLIRRSSLIRP